MSAPRSGTEQVPKPRSSSTIPDASNRYKEHVIQWQKDVSRTLDYLGTRADVDTTKLAYLGFSWGGRRGGSLHSSETGSRSITIRVAPTRRSLRAA